MRRSVLPVALPLWARRIWPLRPIVSRGRPVGRAANVCARAGTGRARRVQGAPARMSAGDVGGRRFAGCAPKTASRELRKLMTKGRRNVNLVSLSKVYARGSSWDSWPRHAKRPSTGGDVAAYSPADGHPCSLSGMWTPRAATRLRASPRRPAASMDRGAARYYRQEAVVAPACRRNTCSNPLVACSPVSGCAQFCEWEISQVMRARQFERAFFCGRAPVSVATNVKCACS